MNEELRRQLRQIGLAIEAAHPAASIVEDLRAQLIQFQPRFDVVRAQQDIFRSALAPFEDAIRFQQDYFSALTASLTQQLTQFELPDFTRWFEEDREAVNILASRGWWPHPDWPFSVLRQVIRIKQSGEIVQLDRMICEMHEVDRARPMRQALERWRSVPEFKARAKLFGDGLWAYRNKRYSLAVSQWIPQVEGILRAFTERTGLAPGGWKRTHGVLREAQPDFATEYLAAFFDALESLYDDSLARGKSLPPSRKHPGRDEILHGVHLRFGRRAYAMRIFLMLDTLHNLIVEYEKAASEAA